MPREMLETFFWDLSIVIAGRGRVGEKGREKEGKRREREKLYKT